MPDADAPRGPIFVVGSLGSGSTLLRLMLDSHDDIAIPQETGFLRLAMANHWVPYWNFGGEWYRRLGLDEAELDARLRDFYGGLFAEYAAARGKSRWGDKTPYHVWHVDLALRLFPDAVFVGIVRHPGGVADSLHGRFRYQWRHAIRHWMRTNRRLAHEATTRPDRFVIVRYEDLVGSPEVTMRALVDWLGEPWSDRVLAHHEVQPRSGAPRVVEGHTRSDAPIDPDRASRWTEHLDADARQLLVTRTTPVARFFGYDVEHPDRRESLATRELAPGVATGADLLARRQTHGSGIDWDNPPEPGPENRLLTPPAPRSPGKRRPGIAPVRKASTPTSAPSAARRLVERLPWWLHRRVDDYRRGRGNR